MTEEGTKASVPVEGDKLRKISKEDINKLPLAKFGGTIHLITTPSAAEQAVKRLSRESILGFDTESRPSFRKGENFPPSLVQFAAGDGVYLFQLGRIGGLDALVRILENPAISKVGVALHDDIKRLKAIQDFEEAGFVEISNISRKLSIGNTGLRSLAALLLGIRISKGAQVSNWARRQLTQSQMVYAATDAWISRELYLKLQEEHPTT